MPISLVPSSTEKLSASINGLIDTALQVENAAQEPRDYLGGSRLGVECLRRLYYELRHPRDAEPFPGRALRRFRLGHIHEDETARWLKLAGFDLRTVNEKGEQFGFMRPQDEIGGHVDGDLVGGPIELPYPLLWEHKIMKSSSWTQFQKDGVAISHPVYWAQSVVYGDQLCRAYTLFTALHTDTSELWFELVRNDPGPALRLLEKGRRVTGARSEHDLPRIATTETDYRCRMCSFAQKCWAVQEQPKAPPPTLPPWLRRKA